MKTYEVIIIGGGCAGMACAISCFDNGVKDILIIDKNPALGGILNQCIHSGFGLETLKKELTGPEFVDFYQKELEKRHIESKVNTFVLNLTKDKIVTYSNRDEGVQEIKANAIVLSTGCYERGAGGINLGGNRPYGVITAGTAQLAMNIYGQLLGKKVFILGSGDIGLIMARRFTLEGAEVVGVAEICPYSNGLNRNIKQCLDDFNIPLYLSTTVKRVIGKNRVEAVEICKVDENKTAIPGTEKIIECDTLLLSVGLIPYSQLFKNIGCEMARNSGALIDNNYMSSLEGFFTCGNVLHVHDLVDLVVEESFECGKNVANYLNNTVTRCEEKIHVKNGECVNYVLPHSIYINPTNDVELKFRVNKPIKNVNVSVYLNENKIMNVFKPYVYPSLMEIIKVKRDLLNTKGELIVKIEAKK